MTDQSRIDRLEGGVEQMGERITSVENGIVSVGANINSRFDAFESSIDSRFNTLDSRFDTLENLINARCNTFTLVLLGNMTVTVLAAVGVIVVVLQAG